MGAPTPAPEVTQVSLSSSPHPPPSTTLAGVIYSRSGNDILYDPDQCLCVDPVDCEPPDSHLYPYTNYGLDRLVQKYMEYGEAIPKFTGLDPYINGPEYDFYWWVRGGV